MPVLTPRPRKEISPSPKEARTEANCTAQDERFPADHRERDEWLRAAATHLLHSSNYAALRRLRCEASEAVIAVHGILPSYYLKQMAQSAIQRLNGIRGVNNLVEVQATHPV